MIVRRFMNWLRLTVAASLGGARRRTAERDAREPVLVGASPQSGVADPSPAALTLSSWLDNGRRLRPRLRLPQALREPDKVTTRPLRYKIQPALSQSTAEPAAPQVSLTSAAATPADPAPVAPATHVDEHAEGEVGDDLGNLERLDADMRRLMVLRHLVRRRIFNEGFAGNDVPHQYRRSLGMEASPPRE